MSLARTIIGFEWRQDSAAIPLAPENLYVHPSIESVEPYYRTSIHSRLPGAESFEDATT